MSEKSNELKNKLKIKKKTKIDKRIEVILKRVQLETPKYAISALFEVTPLIYKTKTMHREITKAIIPFLDTTDEEAFKPRWKLLISVISRKSEIFDEFAPLVFKILKMPSMKESLRMSCYADLPFHPKLLKSEIEFLLNNIQFGKDLSDRRNAIWVAETLGSKNPETASKLASTLMEYVKSPETIKNENEEKKVFRSEVEDLGITFEISMGGPDESETLLADSIDAIGNIGSKYPEIVSDCIPALEKISKRTDGSYVIKKAVETLEKIRK